MDAQRFPVASVWLFDIDAQEFRGHTVGAPDSLNTLDGSSLRPGSVVIMRRTAAPGDVSDAEAPVAEEEPAQDGPTVLPVPPPGGWTYGLACTSDLAALIAVQQFTVVSVWLFKADTQRFLSHTVGLPDVVNSLDDSMLTPGSVVMMRRGDVVPVAEPHEFYGSAAAGSGPTLDGELVADGTVIIAWDQDGEALLRAAVAGGDWVIDVSEGEAARVAFSIEGSEHSAPYDVVAGPGPKSPSTSARRTSETAPATRLTPASPKRKTSAIMMPPLTRAMPPPATGTIPPPVMRTMPAPVTRTMPPPVTRTMPPPATGTMPPPVTRTMPLPVTTVTPPLATMATWPPRTMAMPPPQPPPHEGDTAAADEGDTAAADDEAAPGPTALPNTGSGGLGGGGLPVLPVALAVALTLGLAATALVRRSRP